MSQRRPMVVPFPAQRSLRFESKSASTKTPLNERVVLHSNWQNLPSFVRKAAHLNLVAPEWADTIEQLIDDLLEECG